MTRLNAHQDAHNQLQATDWSVFSGTLQASRSIYSQAKKQQNVYYDDPQRDIGIQPGQRLCHHIVLCGSLGLDSPRRKMKLLSVIPVRWKNPGQVPTQLHFRETMV
jgi:hypothetical protein